MGIVRLWTLLFLVAAAKLTQAEYCNDYDFYGKKCPENNYCIQINSICDGLIDCNEGSDELYCNAEIKNSCTADNFQCSDGTCLPRSKFCNKRYDCRDKSDELFCEIGRANFCVKTWFKCQDRSRCIPKNWECDGVEDCSDKSDEIGCVLTKKFVASNSTTPPNQNNVFARHQGAKWLLNRRRNYSSTDRWGHDVHRIALSLYFADERFFILGNKTGEEISYELTIQLLNKLLSGNKIRDPELAMYIQALTVTCADPREFFGHNLVYELRMRVEASNYTNPFEILTLCNVRDNMVSKDIERVTTAFDSTHLPFWTDTQATAALALQCLSTSPNVEVNGSMIKNMQEELKKHQFRNGTVDNPITTALVLQALSYNDGYKEFFNLSGAMSVLLDSQDSTGSWGSVRNSYYVLPALDFKSQLKISSKHCVKKQENDEDVLKKLQDAKGQKFAVQYSIRFGDDLVRTWRVTMDTSRNYSLYDVIETVRNLESKHNVEYNVIDYKPYVSFLYGKQNEPELDLYWFTYVRSGSEVVKRIESSPVDVKIEPNQEFILWYKPGNFHE